MTESPDPVTGGDPLREEALAGMPATSGHPGPAGRRFAHLLGAWCVILLAVYATVAVARHETFRSTGFDLGLFDQVVWHLGNGDRPASSLKDLSSIFGDHFSPVLLLFAPLGALDAGPVPLLVAQSALVAASVVPVALFARPRLGDGGALLVAVAYGLSCGVQSAMAFDFHEVAAAPLLIAGAILLADRGAWRRSAACALALLLVKEDLSFLVLAFGAWYAVQRRPREALLCAVGGLAWYAWVTKAVIPHFAGGRAFTYWSYDQIGRSPQDALAGLLTRPLHALHVFVTPRRKVRTMLVLLGSFAFLPLVSIELILAAPLIAERMLSTNAKYWTLQDHYSLTIAPILAVGFARALPTCATWAARRWSGAAAMAWVRVLPAGVAATAVASCLHFGAGDVLDPSRYRVPDERRGAGAALATIPAGASVAATNHLVAHLSQRDRVELLDAGSAGVDFIAFELANAAPETHFPFASAADQDRALARLRRRYVTVYRAGGVEVWRRRSYPRREVSRGAAVASSRPAAPRRAGGHDSGAPRHARPSPGGNSVGRPRR